MKKKGFIKTLTSIAQALLNLDRLQRGAARYVFSLIRCWNELSDPRLAAWLLVELCRGHGHCDESQEEGLWRTGRLRREPQEGLWRRLSSNSLRYGAIPPMLPSLPMPTFIKLSPVWRNTPMLPSFFLVKH